MIIPYNAQGGIVNGPVTGLPIPRFVSLKSKTVNMRVGPGLQYAIAWLYRKRGLPVEVIQEFERWRRIRDSEGTTGWVLHSLLSSKRTAIVAPWAAHRNSQENDKKNISVFSGKKMAATDSLTIVHLQAGLVVSIEYCYQNWCKINAHSTRAWMKQDSLWGIYPGEKINR
ncbi:SH3 domain-containing protein [Candidatus Endowatersipora endosymbiont of Watersipora subatra]|uniref:SH3 domain-containing protein n=1 Tax=Candidatus Endowatersipora endosymbiont of Watersipora subatra TaxID=3077946 RepID=UPI00312CB890